MKNIFYFFILLIAFISYSQKANADIINPKFTKILKTFYINKEGISVEKPQNLSIETKIQNDLNLTEENGKYGFKDKDNKWKIKPEFDYALDFHENLAGACKENKCGFIDKKGKWVIKPEFPMLICTYQTSNGIYKRNSSPLCTNNALYSNFSEGLAPIYYKLRETNKSYKYGKYTETDNQDNRGDFSQGYTTPYQCGYINKEGEIIIKDDSFQRCGTFSEELAPVSLGRIGFTYIDKNGVKKQNLFYYDRAYSFKNGIAKISKYIYAPRKLKNVRIK